MLLFFGENMVVRDDISVIEHLKLIPRPGHILVIDPDDQTPEMAAKRSIACVLAGTRCIFVGGSTAVDGTPVHDTVVAIQESLELCKWNATQDSEASEDDWNIPVLLFPAGARALSPAADAITFMTLMNSRNLQFVMGEQILGGPIVQKMGIEPIAMGYIVFSPGGKVGEVGEADLILPDQMDRCIAHAATSECFGFPLIYLEAGSGASSPVLPEMISAAKKAAPTSLIIVGGGMHNGELAQQSVRAGADWIVTGNLTEEFDDAAELEKVMCEYIQKMRE
ncbi:MAG: phosphoglycerol geranylgeranyltransferase [Euryarchaeota archaeon]|nr:phosphoglycerol geranylgeranyltransferase [Euryarchaeota archaeon]